MREKGFMAFILSFTHKWSTWYLILRGRKGFGVFDSARYGFWLARSADLAGVSEVSIGRCPESKRLTSTV